MATRRLRLTLIVLTVLYGGLSSWTLVFSGFMGALGTAYALILVPVTLAVGLLSFLVLGYAYRRLTSVDFVPSSIRARTLLRFYILPVAYASVGMFDSLPLILPRSILLLPPFLDLIYVALFHAAVLVLASWVIRGGIRSGP